MFEVKKRRKISQIPIDIIRNVFFAYYAVLMRFRKQHKYIMIIAMKRSGSSLLTHLLSSNPEINGHGEAWIKYNSEKDFNSLVRIVHWTRRMLKMPTEFVLDKMVHDVLIPKPELLNNKNAYKIFLIREPKSTLPSLIKEELKYLEQYTAEDAVNEYIKRLKTLESNLDAIEDKSRCLFLTYSDITEESSKSLSLIQTFLSLKEALNENYKLNRTSGKPIFGDTGKMIKKGKIVKQKGSQHKEIEIPENLLIRAEEAFASCKKKFAVLKKEEAK